MKQHIVSRWLLEDFGHDAKGGRRLWVYQKGTGQLRERAASETLIEVDAHSIEVERRLQKLEGPAANAARTLGGRLADLPSGFCLLEGDVDRPEPEHPMRAVGRFDDFELFTTDRQRALPAPADRHALADFIALAFARAPGVGRAMDKITLESVRGIRAAARKAYERAAGRDAELGFLRAAALHAEVRELDIADRFGAALVSHDWWVFKAGSDAEFVIGDAPVFGALAIGHDPGWTRLLDENVYVLVFPFTPKLALFAASRRFMPTAPFDGSLVEWVNDMEWRRAAASVVGHRQADLAAVRSRVTDPDAMVAPQVDVEGSQRAGVLFFLDFLVEVARPWQYAYRPACRRHRYLVGDTSSHQRRIPF
ncbi:MAG: DUF4238 domain-containing protein [Candidatus Limnocylindrales bacterium]